MKNIFLSLVAFFIFSSVYSQSIKDLRKFFEYKKSEDLDLRLGNGKDTADAIVYNLVYTSVNALKVTACLVVPNKSQKQHPAVIFLHGEGQNKSVFLNEAIELAKESIISLILDAPPARPSNFRLMYLNYQEPRKDFNAYRQTVMDVRRGIDLLEKNPMVDRYRMAFIGVDKGSWTGAILAAVDNRIPFYILMGCSPCPTCDLKNSKDPGMVKIRNSLTQEQITQYELQMKYLDPVNYLGNRFESKVFFQFAENDLLVSEDMSDLAFKTTSEPKLEKYYPASHFGLITFPESKTDRKNWIKKQLN